ncbi:hypothetical protein ACTFIZ_001680 [Dictyostelium cf. discoideum]
MLANRANALVFKRLVYLNTSNVIKPIYCYGSKSKKTNKEFTAKKKPIGELSIDEILEHFILKKKIIEDKENIGTKILKVEKANSKIDRFSSEVFIKNNKIEDENEDEFGIEEMISKNNNKTKKPPKFNRSSDEVIIKNNSNNEFENEFENEEITKNNKNNKAPKFNRSSDEVIIKNNNNNNNDNEIENEEIMLNNNNNNNNNSSSGRNNKKASKMNRFSSEVIIKEQNDNNEEIIVNNNNSNNKASKMNRFSSEVIIKEKNNNNDNNVKEEEKEEEEEEEEEDYNNNNNNNNNNIEKDEIIDNIMNGFEGRGGGREESAVEFLKRHRIEHQVPKSTIYLKEKTMEEDEMMRKRLSINRNNINFGNNKDRKQIFTKKSYQNGAGILPKGLANTVVKNNWMKRQMTDPYVAMAQKNDLISRAAYKIINIDEQIQLFKPGQIVVDLGAAPGGWSKYIQDRVTNRGLVISVDTSSNFQLDKDCFIHGDFTLTETQNKIFELTKFKSLNDLKLYKHSLILSDSKVQNLINADAADTSIIQNGGGAGGGGAAAAADSDNSFKQKSACKVDVVVSDMAPSYSGLQQVDHSRLIDLQRLALFFSFKTLKKGGTFVCKVSRGGEEKKFFKLLESNFISVKSMKPGASRLESTEIYYIGKNFIGK